MAPRIDTVFEDDDLLLRWRDGTARRMVVVFTGVRAGFGGAPADGCAREDVLSVTDRNLRRILPGARQDVAGRLKATGLLAGVDALHARHAGGAT